MTEPKQNEREEERELAEDELESVSGGLIGLLLPAVQKAYDDGNDGSTRA